MTLYFRATFSIFLRKSFYFYRIMAGIVLLLCLLTCRVSAKVGPSLKADTSKKCAICHYKWVSTFFFEHRDTPIARADEKSLEMFSWEVCISCHDGSIRDSRNTICNDPGHRVGRVPSKRISIPSDFPLDKNGALKCTTCHTPHAVSEESESMVENFLRAPNENSSLCKTCHSRRLGGVAKGNHPIDVAVNTRTGPIRRGGGKFGGSHSDQIICETCHRAHGGVNNKRLVLPVEDTESMSVLCETCHTKNALLPGAVPGKRRSHPVDIRPEKEEGVQLPSAWANGEKVVTGLKGELVCRTCHKPHQANGEFLLATPKGKDALCLQCHLTREYVEETSPKLNVPAPSGQESATKTAAKEIPCTSCHLVHQDIADFIRTRRVSSEQADLEQFFRIPHFELHPRTFFGTALLKKDGTKIEGISLFTERGDSFENGIIVCTTCHNVQHLASGIGAQQSGDSNISATGFLQPDIAERFCKACHGEEALVRFLYFHEKW